MPSPPWFEDDEFWAAIEPFEFDAPRIAAGEAEAAALQSLIHLAPGARILDMCCGPGRVSVPLAKAGYSVTGVDRFERYLQAARDRAVAARVAVEFVCDDMRTFRRPECFDAAVCLFTSFGYFREPADDLRVLTNIAESLTRGGAFLLDAFSAQSECTRFRHNQWREAGGTLLIEEKRVIGDWDEMEATWHFINADCHRQFEVFYRLYTPAALERLMVQAGFEEVQMLGNWHRDPWKPDSPQLLALARTPT